MKLAKAEAIYRPNLLINGDFQVWQRGDSTTLSNVSETGYKYFADRWCRYFSSTSSASETYEKVSNGMKYTSTTQPNATITQLLETGLKSGNKYTLSASVNDIIHVMTFDGQVDKSEGILSYIKGVSTIPYDRIIFSVSNNDIVNWVKLEQGSIATPFVPRLMAEEFLLSQRYEQISNYVHGMGIAYYGSVLLYLPLSCPLRATPKVSFSGIVSAIRDGIDSQNITSMTYVGHSDSLVIISCATSGSVENGTVWRIEGGKIELDAEIY